MNKLMEEMEDSELFVEFSAPIEVYGIEEIKWLQSTIDNSSFNGSCSIERYMGKDNKPYSLFWIHSQINGSPWGTDERTIVNIVYKFYNYFYHKNWDSWTLSYSLYSIVPQNRNIRIKSGGSKTIKMNSSQN